MLLGAIAAIVVGVALGFVPGGLISRQSRRWCPECGSTADPADQRRRTVAA